MILKQERLDRLSKFRASSSAIRFPVSKPRAYIGGKAEVVPATIKEHILASKKQVAVKKLRSHGGMDSHLFENVMLSVFPRR